MSDKVYTYKKSMRRRRRPLKALHHFRKLLKNKEDTTQVFYVIEALNGDSFQKHFLKFANSEMGRHRLEEAKYLPPLLDDHDWLRTLPEQSLGHAYLEFMTREGLTAQGLVDEYVTSGIERDFRDPDMNIYGDRRRDTHDMLHVLTGFGRDALGEACVLAFSYAQHGGPGVAFIAYGAAFELKRSAPKGAPVIKSVRQAQKMGQTALDLIYYDVMELLPRPLSEVREMLNITCPTQYHAAHKIMHDVGVDPYTLFATT